MSRCLHRNALLGCSHRHFAQATAAGMPFARPHLQQQRPNRRSLRVTALGFDFGDAELDSRLAAEPARPSPKAFSAYTLVGYQWGSVVWTACYCRNCGPNANVIPVASTYTARTVNAAWSKCLQWCCPYMRPLMCTCPPTLQHSSSPVQQTQDHLKTDTTWCCSCNVANTCRRKASCKKRR